MYVAAGFVLTSLFPLLFDSSCPHPSPRLHASLTILPRPPFPLFLSSPVFGPFHPSLVLFGLDRRSLRRTLDQSLSPHPFPNPPLLSFPTLPRPLLLHYTLSLVHREISSKSRSWFIRPVLRGCESRHELMQRKRGRARNGQRERGGGGVEGTVRRVLKP